MGYCVRGDETCPTAHPPSAGSRVDTVKPPAKCRTVPGKCQPQGASRGMQWESGEESLRQLPPAQTRPPQKMSLVPLVARDFDGVRIQ